MDSGQWMSLTRSCKKLKAIASVHFVIEKVQLSFWYDSFKRLMDILIAASGLIFMSPLIAYIALRVLYSSNGPVLYVQERVGLHGAKFRMYKFRSMFIDAERHGPLLARENDARVTRWGTFMRRWKLDEIPQLWNVLTGDMSLVGPRPEREYFIKQLANAHHSFEQLLAVKPGLTSLGIVKVGYAANTEQMIERMKYDIEYLGKRSLLLDIIILVRSVKAIISANGK